MPSWKSVSSVSVTSNKAVAEKVKSIDYVKSKAKDATVRVYIEFDRKYQGAEEIDIQIKKVIDALPKSSLFQVRRINEKEYSITADISLIYISNVRNLSNVLLVKIMEETEINSTTKLNKHERHHYG